MLTELSYTGDTLGTLNSYPLLEALLHRRSRRFGKGMRLNGGPLAFSSSKPPQPLTVEEEAALAFAACGITGYALGELPYEAGDVPNASTGNIMAQFIGRTAASADALHTATVFVINDDGVWMLRRPQDYARVELRELIHAAQEGRLVDLYRRARVQIADRRLDMVREIPFTQPFNKWSANLPGTTYFLPVAELTAPYINGLLYAFSDEFAGFAVDDHNWYLPAGIARFGRSRGGFLHDRPSDDRVGPVNILEAWLDEGAAVEIGGIVQNLGLMTQALGLGGFANCALHPYAWFQALGFRMEHLTASRVIGLPSVLQHVAKLFRLDMPVPTAVGLERDAQVLIQPYCPPYYRNMEEAVLAFVDFKYARGSGTFCDSGAASSWKDGAAVQHGIPRYSDRTIAATIAYSDYIYKRYGRFPAMTGPFRTVVGYQAHHLDEDFYDQFYRPEALSDTQRGHSACSE